MKRPRKKRVHADGGLLQRITVQPKVLLGKPTIRGMRISVEQILRMLSEGMSSREILREFPVLEEEDVRAAVAYAHKILSAEKVYIAETA